MTSISVKRDDASHVGAVPIITAVIVTLACSALGQAPDGAAPTGATAATELDYSRYGPVSPGHQSACGVECLYVASRLFGLQPALSDLASDAGLSMQGTSLLGLKQAAEAVGFQAQGIRYAPEDWAAIKPLSIAHFRSGHFVLILKVGQEHIEALDPPRHRLRLTPAEFMERWSGHVLELTRPAVTEPANGTHVTTVVVQQGATAVAGKIAFGPVYAEREYPFLIHIRNASSEALRFSRFVADCGCTTVQPDDSVIGPSAEGSLRGVLSTAGMNGELRRKAVAIFEAGETSVTVSVDITATVSAEGVLRAFPPRLGFRALVGERSPDQALVVRRDSGEALSLKAVRADQPWLSVAEVPVPKMGPAETRLILHAREVLPAGEHKAVLTVETEHPKFADLRVPVTVEVSCDIQARPESLVVHRIARASSVDVSTIRLVSRSGQRFKVISAILEPATLGRVTFEDSLAASHEVEFRLNQLVSEADGQLVRGRLNLTLDHPACPTVSVPLFVSHDPTADH